MSTRKTRLAIDAEMAELREDRVWPPDGTVKAITQGAGRRAVTLLSAWEGLGRFSRERYGVEPLVPTQAWRLITEDRWPRPTSSTLGRKSTRRWRPSGT